MSNGETEEPQSGDAGEQQPADAGASGEQPPSDGGTEEGQPQEFEIGDAQDLEPDPTVALEGPTKEELDERDRMMSTDLLAMGPIDDVEDGTAIAETEGTPSGAPPTAPA